MFDDNTLENNSLNFQSTNDISFDLNTTDLLFNSSPQHQAAFDVNTRLEQDNFNEHVAFNAQELNLFATSADRTNNFGSGNKTVDIANADSLTGLDRNIPIVGNNKFQSNSDSLNSFNSNITASAASGTLTVKGTLYGDTFNLTSGYQRYVVSGNGNVNRVNGYQDILNLSGIFSNAVQYNWANTTTGGVLYNPGNGSRIFDSIKLSNGVQILFEGIDRVVFKDQTINLSVTPNDSLFNQQWNLHMMGVDNAWRFTRGSNQVLMGVQDTGLGLNSSGYVHPEIRGTTIYPNNYRDDYTSRNFTHDSHGTAVQSIISANTNNGVGMSGINWNSPVFNIDVLGGSATDQSLYLATQNMINYANSQGQKLIINMSLGGGGRESGFENLVANNQNKALFVIATGNDNVASLSYPSWLAYYYNNVIAVGASWGAKDAYGNTKNAGTRISYSGGWGSNYGYGLSLMGPSEVIAAKATGAAGSGIASSFGYDPVFAGTSAATPNVAGVASLVWSVNPNLTATQIKTILSQTAFDLGTSGYDLVYGSGFVNADAAVRRAMAIARGASSFSALSTNIALSTDRLNSSSSDTDLNIDGLGVTKTIDRVGATLFNDNYLISDRYFLRDTSIDTFDFEPITFERNNKNTNSSKSNYDSLQNSNNRSTISTEFSLRELDIFDWRNIDRASFARGL